MISIKENPIEEITTKGIRTADGIEHQFDVLVLATGFDGVDGNYRAMQLRGLGGVSIGEHWASGPTSYLGVSTAGFPNLFMILGPNGPFTNIPPSIEAQVNWLTDLIRHAEAEGAVAVEATDDAEVGWSRICQDVADATLFPRADSWIFGTNIPGKPRAVMFYLGGGGNYRQELAKVSEEGRYTGFDFS